MKQTVELSVPTQTPWLPGGAGGCMLVIPHVRLEICWMDCQQTLRFRDYLGCVRCDIQLKSEIDG